MARILLNTVALDPLRWSKPRRSYFALVDLVEPIAEHTLFRSLEVWQYHLAGLTSAEVGILKERLDLAGISVECVALYPVLAGPESGASLDAAQSVARTAAELGAGSAKIFVGNQASASISDADWHTSIDRLKTMIDDLGALGLALSGETHADTLFDDVLTVEHVLAAVGEGRMGICFQPYHFADSHGTIEIVRKLAPDVRHLHFQGRTTAGDFCRLEDAPIDYRRMLGVLARAGFDGLLSIEFVKDCVVDAPEDLDLGLVLANAEADRRYLAQIAAEAGLAMAR